MTTTATGDRHTVPISSMPAGRHSARSGGNGVLLALLLVGQFMALLDATIVNVAMRTIGTDLQASGASLQLIVSGYTVSYAVLLITGARLGNIIGRRRMFLYGLLGFVAASLLCGLAPNTLTLIVMRFIQGAGAAAMVPQILSMINAQFTGPARSRALGAYSAVIAIGAVAGQVAGGILVDADIAGAGLAPDLPRQRADRRRTRRSRHPHHPARRPGRRPQARPRRARGGGALGAARRTPAGARPRVRLAGLVVRADGARRRRWWRSSSGSSAGSPPGVGIRCST